MEWIIDGCDIKECIKTRTVPPLNVQFELSKMAHDGFKKARDALVLTHLGVAKHVCSKMVVNALPREDRNQLAFQGLVEAVDLYDPEKNVAFGKFAIWHIQKLITLNNISHTNVVTFRKTGVEKAQKIRAASHELLKRLKREPSGAEIQYETGETGNMVSLALNIHSGDYFDTTGEESDLVDNIFLKEVWDKAKGVLNGMRPRTKRIVTLYYDLDGTGYRMPQDEIKAKLRIAKKTIRRELDDFLKVMRRTLANT